MEKAKKGTYRVSNIELTCEAALIRHHLLAACDGIERTSVLEGADNVGLSCITIQRVRGNYPGPLPTQDKRFSFSTLKV